MAELLYTIESEALPSDARVVAVTGREALSEPYVFEIGILTSDEEFDPDAALRATARLEFNLNPDAGGDEKPYFFHGILREVDLVHEYDGELVYKLTLVPRLWDLTQSFHSRIFTKLSIPDIIAKILENYGLAKGTDFDIHTIATYPKVEHVCMYKESHFDFISRWMEREGLYYFFEQSEHCEKLVITDSITSNASLKSGDVRFVAGLEGEGDATAKGEHLRHFAARHRARPADVLLRDYDYLKPTLDLNGTHTVDKNGNGQIQIFGENLVDPTEAKRYAQVRAEEIACKKVTFEGEGRVFHLRPNYRFTLDEHPNAKFEGKSYLVTQLIHQGNQLAHNALMKRRLGMVDLGDEEYSVHLTAIRDDVQFRASRRATWPRIEGYELADVCGAATSNYAQIDDHGRYQVRAYFDEGTMPDGNATTFIRMMQPHGGANEGFHFPLRKGTEVALFFLNGDPDRPVIAGVVPNALKMSPVNKTNHTKNVIQTGGKNLFEMNDQAGSECIHMGTPASNSFIRMGAVRSGSGPLGGVAGALHSISAGGGASGGGASAAAAQAAADWLSPAQGEQVGYRAAAALMWMAHQLSASAPTAGDGDATPQRLQAALGGLGLSIERLLVHARKQGCDELARALADQSSDVMVAPDAGAPIAPSSTPSFVRRAPPTRGATAYCGAETTEVAGSTNVELVVEPAVEPEPGRGEHIDIRKLLADLRSLAGHLAASSEPVAGDNDQATSISPSSRIELLADAIEGERDGTLRVKEPENIIGPTLYAQDPTGGGDKTSEVDVDDIPLEDPEAEKEREKKKEKERDDWVDEEMKKEKKKEKKEKGDKKKEDQHKKDEKDWYDEIEKDKDKHKKDKKPKEAMKPLPSDPPGLKGPDPDPLSKKVQQEVDGLHFGTEGDHVSIHDSEVVITHGSASEFISGKENKMVKGDGFTQVDGHETKIINGGVTEVVTGGENKTVNGGVTETVHGGETRHVTGIVNESIFGIEMRTVTGGIMEHVLAIQMNTVAGPVFEKFAGVEVKTVGGAVIEGILGAEIKHVAGAEYAGCNGAGFHFHAGPYKNFSANTEVMAGSKVLIEAPLVTVKSPETFFTGQVAIDKDTAIHGKCVVANTFCCKDTVEMKKDAKVEEFFRAISDVHLG